MLFKFIILTILLDKSFAFIFSNGLNSKEAYIIENEDSLRMFQKSLEDLNRKIQYGHRKNQNLLNYMKRILEYLDSVKEKDLQMKLMEERRDNIFRKYLASRSQSSFTRDFVTMRY
jgi:hypothetical protein